MIKYFSLTLTALLIYVNISTACDKPVTGGKVSQQDSTSLILPEEKHFANIKQLTFGGENAETYFSLEGDKFSFQSTRDGFKCDQIYTMNIDGTNIKQVSNGKGRTTCAYFLPGGNRILFASTHEGGDDCPPKPDFSKGYVWALYDTYDIYSVDTNGNNMQKLTDVKGYDAEATVSPKGDKIVFTSTRDGDIDIYTMNLDGSGVMRLTDEPGYDGGAFFSPDGSKIVYRASRPQEGKELDDYRALLLQGLIRPSKLDIYVMDADGSNKTRVTDNNAANFAPFFHPDGKRIIFASNIADPMSRNFDIYMVNIDGTGLERITYYDEFDGFPMFSPDGKKLVFSSNRNNSQPGETNVFIVDWVE